MRRVLFLLPAVMFAWACAASGSGQGSGGGSMRVLTGEQIVQSGYATAMEGVERLRPQWLQSGASSFRSARGDRPSVYLDGVLVDFSELRAIRATQVDRMEYLSPTDATNRYGTNHTGGAILVTTR